MQKTRYISVIIALLVSWGLMTGMSVMSQNAPVSTVGTVSSYGNTATVPVTASNVSNIGSFSIKIVYDPAIVHPVSVTTTSQIGGTLSVNLNNTGVIFLSWFNYPGITVSGNPVILNIDFTKIALGTSSLTWYDDGFSCAWYDGNSVSLNDTPTANYYIGGSLTFNSPDAPHTIVPSVSACPGTAVSIPVRVTAFSNIGMVSLTLKYPGSALSYQNFTNTSGFPGLAIDGTQPGTLIITGTIQPAGPGFSLPDSSTLLSLDFNFLGGVADIIWYDDGVSCQHSGPPPSFFILNDSPQAEFYVNGSVSQLPLPATPGAIAGPSGGDVCAGQTGVNFSVSPVQHADSYTWALPPGAVVTSGAMTNNITVSFGTAPGTWDITVYGTNTCGNGPGSPASPVYVNAPPSITVQPVSPAPVNAGNGIASFAVEAAGSFLSYQWQEFTSSWNDLANDSIYTGVLSPALTITNPPAAMNGNRYRCVISGFCLPQSVSDGEATLTVSPLTGTGNQYPGSNGNTDRLILDIHPNPATSATTVTFYLPASGRAVIEISTMYGKTTDLVYNGYISGGSHKLNIPVELNPGLYLLTLSLQTGINVYKTTKKLIVE